MDTDSLRRAVRAAHHDSDGDKAALGAFAVHGEPLAADEGEFGAQRREVRTFRGAAAVPLWRVALVQFGSGPLGQEQQPGRRAGGGEHHSLPGANPKRLPALGAGDEPRGIAHFPVLPYRILESSAQADTTLEVMTTSPVHLASPGRVRPASAPDQPDVTPALEKLYRGFGQALAAPLGTEIRCLMSLPPRSA